MNIEFIVNKELANICVTATEFSRLTQIINAQIKKEAFSALFNAMMGKMVDSYDVVVDVLAPFPALDNEASFTERYEASAHQYREDYLMVISKARSLQVDAYEDYEHLKCMREAKTSFPLLKRSFERLEILADKWIANDYWLAMSIDTLLKMWPRLLQEVSEIKQKDPEDAWLIYQAAVTDLELYHAVLRKQSQSFRAQLLGTEKL
ncbi:MAG: hypothetical protein ACWA44_03935 [Thiotrichales bacterium]